MNRLWVPLELEAGASIALADERSHYLIRVLRARRGDPLTCFDGSGREFSAVVDDADVRRCRLAIGTETARRSIPEAVHVGLALTKKDVDLVAQKATELGVTDIWLLRSDRTVAFNARFERLQNVIVAAAEQSGRLFLPRLHEPRVFADFLDDLPAVDERLIWVPGAAAIENSPNHGSCAMLVGPEGGWTNAERSYAQDAGFREAGLGPLTLRATTAAIAGLAAWRQSRSWSDSAP